MDEKNHNISTNMHGWKYSMLTVITPLNAVLSSMNETVFAVAIVLFTVAMGTNFAASAMLISA